MTIPYSHSYSFPTTNDFTKKPQVKTTTLENGIKVITQNQLLSPGSAVGMIIKGGNRLEEYRYKGYNWLAEKMTFQSSKNYPSATSLSLLDRFSSNVYSISLKEELLVNCEVASEFVPQLVDLMFDSSFHLERVDHELRTQLDSILRLSQTKFDYPEYLFDELHKVAYAGKGLGKGKFLIEKEIISHFHYEKLNKYLAEYYVPHRMVLAAVGVDHEAFVDHVNSSFGKLRKIEEISKYDQKQILKSNYHSPYVGGDLFIADQRREFPLDYSTSSNAYPSTIILAFEAANLNQQRENCIFHILCSMIGSGSSFSSGGPGKGMRSRSYLQLLCKPFVDHVHTFFLPYSDSGLFGMAITGNAAQYSSLMMSLVEFIGNIPFIKEEEFTRAKNQAKSALFSSCESRSTTLYDLQIRGLHHPEYLDPQSIAALFDDITLDEVENTVREVLIKPPTLVAFAEEKFLKRSFNSLDVQTYLNEILNVPFVL